MKKLLLIVSALLLIHPAGAMEPEAEEPAQKKLCGDFVSAAWNGNIDAVEQHFAAGVPVDEAGGWPMTALAAAASNGHEQMCKLLLEYGADPNKEICNAHGHSSYPLASAACSGSEVICTLLIQYGADVNKKDRSGHTALMVAAYYGQEQTYQFLISCGAKKENKAVAADNFLCVVLNMFPGARCPQRFSYKCTDVACSEIIVRCKLLLDYGVEPNCRYGQGGTSLYAQGNTPLIEAAAKGHRGVSGLLLVHQRVLNKSVIIGLMCLRKICWPLYEQRCVLKPYLEDHTVQAMLRTKNNEGQGADYFLDCDWLQPKVAKSEDGLKPKEKVDALMAVDSKDLF